MEKPTVAFLIILNLYESLNDFRTVTGDTGQGTVDILNSHESRCESLEKSHV